MKEQRFICIISVLIISVAFPYFCAHSRIINVPEEERTIQRGIDNAESGDTVLVQPGVYWEWIHFSDCPSVTVASLFLTTGNTVYIDSTVINPSNRYAAVYLNSDHQICALIGFTITNGNGNRGGGIHISSPRTTISHVNIIGNEGIEGGGIYIGENCNPLIIDTKITECSCLGS